MRQVPHYLIIGNGRMATHFCAYLHLLNIPFSQWSRHEHAVSELPGKLKLATHVLLLIKDGAISEFVEQYCPQFEHYLIHFSGCFSHEKIIGAHPLMTFSHSMYSLSHYQQIPFIIDTNTHSFESLLPGLTNPHYFISKSQKAYYHALCVLSGNFTTLLWKKMFDEFENTLHIPPQAAHLYLKQICSNLMTHPEKALTGPLVRNDLSTLKANINALENDPFQSVYLAFCEAYKRSQHEYS